MTCVFVHYWDTAGAVFDLLEVSNTETDLQNEFVGRFYTSLGGTNFFRALIPDQNHSDTETQFRKSAKSAGFGPSS